MVHACFTSIYQHKPIAVIGFGVTGRACVEFMRRHGAQVSLFDVKHDELRKSVGNEPLLKGVNIIPFNDDSCFKGFDTVVVSPGVNTQLPAIQNALSEGLPLISDIELFARHNSVPAIGITGSNGKSTVVDMLHKGFSATGLKVGVGGNFGNSILAFLDEPYDLIILELSSFQLELTFSLHLRIAAILNVTEDHIDRHGDIIGYARAKQRIFKHADICIVNRDDPRTFSEGDTHRLNSFGSFHSLKVSGVKSGFNNNPSHNANDSRDIYSSDLGISIGDELIVAQEKIRHLANHNVLNAQVALLCAKSILNTVEEMQCFIESVINYSGLAHRFALVHVEQMSNGKTIHWVNDSKATNPGAAIAAIKCIPDDAILVMLVGGDSKGTDLRELRELIRRRVAKLIVLGKDAKRFSNCCADTSFVETIDDAVLLANEFSHATQQNTYVLLSPACASIDMFKNYQERGKQFEQAVLRVEVV
ncbi:UDP-N-acetylmuramoyl-L-alanine--D-glutamate ligase [Agaribacter marinus]|uniref:UDP-N-acetylmuramoylalanine--D-glutamate ligase n=1 Tax=Agaribacter marinus TaxID=1431249 RepID=A0AA37T3Z0_9ALTE|nr:UDP-N-acetylmuramoyl-L-alanine--D-glutamate ligase [Agaribacter marinus]GLR71065.1 UDP-N-acetylmuramoylalanine--D-glutamate ligase [Agaribacter marinus]